MLKDRTQKIARLSVMAALAMILSYVDSWLSFFSPLPGFKIGLANLVIVFLLWEEDVPSALTVNVLRCLLSAFLFTSLYALLYSITGALFSLLAMAWFHKKKPNLSPASIGALGGVVHNLAQWLVACFFLQPKTILWFLPPLWGVGLVTGFLLGWIVLQTLRYYPSSKSA